ncbi:MAG: WYL domain-containing protein [Planctomycetes bacterium]|nr:WYL domain-containing protein [Planctomycetota bacterium]
MGHTEEIKRWIQSFGRHAVVLAPGILRTEIVGELSALQLAYGEGGMLAGGKVTRRGSTDATVRRTVHEGRSRRAPRKV